LTYFWDLNGNGEYDVEGASVWFSPDLFYTKPNASHTVWHKVMDESGLESEPVSLDLNIIAVAPTYVVSGPEEIFERTPTHWEFSAVASRFRPIMDWEIDWGDSSEPTQILGGPRSRIAVTHYFHTPGEYAITIRTTDFDGLVTEVSTGTFTVKEKASEPLPVESFALIEPAPVAPLTFSPPGESQEEPVAMSFAPPVQFASESRFSFTETYLAGLTETMRLRLMLDLDHSGQKPEGVPFSELLWADGDSFESDWFGLSEEPEKSDFWSEAFENELLALK
jgi:hypothetical protein